MLDRQKSRLTGSIFADPDLQVILLSMEDTKKLKSSYYSLSY